MSDSRVVNSSTVRLAFRRAVRAVVVNLYRLLAAVGITSTLICVSGCYTYLSGSATDLNPNSQISAEITDIGRVALGERVGQEVKRVDGKVLQRSDTSFQVLVSQVTYLNGVSDHWQGQAVSLRPRDVKSVTQRTFSRNRTATLIGAIIVGLAVTVLSLNFLGITSGDPGSGKGGNPPPES